MTEYASDCRTHHTTMNSSYDMYSSDWTTAGLVQIYFIVHCVMQLRLYSDDDRWCSQFTSTLYGHNMLQTTCGGQSIRWDHSGRASQRIWSRHTIPNKYGRRWYCGCWLQQNDVTRPACFLAAMFVREDQLTNRRLQTLLLLWLDVRSLENI